MAQPKNADQLYYNGQRHTRNTHGSRPVGDGDRKAGAAAKQPTSALGQRLRDMRLARGWTQTEMARCIDTQGGRVSDWELGVNIPTLPILVRYAAAFDCSVSTILRGVL